MAKATDDFEWPPRGDDVSILEIGPDPWQKLQDASRDAFLARQRERSQAGQTQQIQQPQQPRQTPPPKQAQQPKRSRQPVRTPEPAAGPTRKLTRVLIVSAFIAAAAGWAIQAATAPPVPVQAFHHPVPAVAAPPPPPPFTVVATYPVEPAIPSPAPGNSVDAPASAAAPLDAPPDAPAETDTTAAPASPAPPGGA